MIEGVFWGILEMCDTGLMLYLVMIALMEREYNRKEIHFP